MPPDRPDESDRERRSPAGAPVGCIDGPKAADAVNLANNHILDHGEQGLLSTIGALAGGRGLVRCRGEPERSAEDAGPHARRWPRRCSASPNTSSASPANARPGPTARRDRNRPRAETGSARVRPGSSCWFTAAASTTRIPARVCSRSAGSWSNQRGGGRLPAFPLPAFVTNTTTTHRDCLWPGKPGFRPRRARNASWHEGFLAVLTLLEPGRHRRLIRFRKVERVELPRGGCRRKFSRDFLLRLAERSREIAGEGAVERLWLEYCRSEKYLYASRLKGHNRLMRLINRKLRLTDWLCSRSARLMRRNVVECETHREVLETLWRDPETIF